MLTVVLLLRRPCPHCVGQPASCRHPGVDRAPTPSAVDDPTYTRK